MPESKARQWFIDVARLFSGKPSDLDIYDHAKKLRISDLKDLASCVQGTTSNTARQVVRLLYTPSRLLTMSGTEIPSEERQAIRGMNAFFHRSSSGMHALSFDHLEFAESCKGPISNHMFNEAVNGVFRATKKKDERKGKSSSEEPRRGLERGQQTIRQTISKRLYQESGRPTDSDQRKHAHESISSQLDEPL